MGIYRTTAELDECGRFAWPGGYPLSFYPTDEDGDSPGIVLCFDCARANLTDEHSDGLSLITTEIEDGEQAFYGGVSCDGCNAWIVDPCCPECGDELRTKSRTLHADNVDASVICLDCAAKMVLQRTHEHSDDDAATADTCTGPTAERIPGVGIRIVQPDWYAPAGTLYSYR